MGSLLVLDFDGTITLRDVGDAFCDRFAPPAWREIDAAWIRGELPLPEAQRRMWALVRATEEGAAAGMRDIGTLRPGLAALLAGAAARGVPVWLASGGFDFYIEALLGEELKRFHRRFYNRGHVRDGGIAIEFPHADLACDRCAVCKGKVCDRAKATGARVVFAGDGHSDRCALGRADAIAAVRGSELAATARQRGIAIKEFDRLDELLPLLE